jgi:hypothetical protein
MCSSHSRKTPARTRLRVRQEIEDGLTNGVVIADPAHDGRIANDLTCSLAGRCDHGNAHSHRFNERAPEWLGPVGTMEEDCQSGKESPHCGRFDVFDLALAVKPQLSSLTLDPSRVVRVTRGAIDRAARDRAAEIRDSFSNCRKHAQETQMALPGSQVSSHSQYWRRGWLPAPRRELLEVNPVVHDNRVL